ncbi:hypothetical protein BDW74DRAFT_141983 [Aspergillus multicolor]|uniref:uncharacterized protein n=1 Tax=Aspergillus multicolor TaxID=41759 RepID=UPI003CCD76F5
MARRLPGYFELFQHGTCFGGVESQIEWRRLVDTSAKPTLLRVSVGVEGFEDLKSDFLRGLERLMEV